MLFFRWIFSVTCKVNALSPYSTGNWVRVGSQTQMKSTQKKRNIHGQRQHFALGPNATYIPLEMGFAFATQREEIYTKK